MFLPPGTDMSKEAAEDASDNKVADSSPSGVCAEAVVVTVSGVTTIEPATKITETNSNGGRVRVLIGILVGDFLHNLCDGIFIGAAFAFCGSSTGWSVAISTVVHETAQEISDFMLLTSPSAGNLTPVRALALNFLSGFSTLFGVLIITYNDVSDVAVGLILVFGAGVYIYVAACECMPRVRCKRALLRTCTRMPATARTALSQQRSRISCILFMLSTRTPLSVLIPK
eukprot:2316765-Pleurochrysis_carterae.AAC.1